MRVAVLGCGPAGLLCAHAVARAGHTPVVYSQRKKSEIPGSLHLRGAIPDITGLYPDAAVQIVRMGTEQGYAFKVYGDANHETGWDNYASTYPSWNAFTAYDKLWQMYYKQIEDGLVDQAKLYDLLNSYDLVISTFPQPQLCHARCEFTSTPYWILPLPMPPGEMGRELIVYNGMLEDRWYRYSVLGDHCAIESAQPMFGAQEGRKVVDNNCDCWPGIVRAGRWAEWRHGVLLHDAYHRAEKAMEELDGRSLNRAIV